MTPARLLLVVAAAAVMVPAVPTAASASCSGSPPPAEAVFTGTVTATDHNGRRATVATDDGRTVTVVGTPDLDASATSVDRSYEVGGRYEFHTLNDTSPFEDNACTLTRKIGTGEVPKPAWSNWPITVGAAGTVLAAAALTIVLVRRRRPESGSSH